MGHPKDEVVSPGYQEIACQQVLLQDASVYSVQWLVIPDRSGGTLTAQALLESYLKLIGEWTCSLIRPAASAEGIEFRLLGTSLVLLGFDPPEYLSGPETEAVRLRINGGVLVQERGNGRGMFSLSSRREAGGLRIEVLLSDYCAQLLGSARPSPARRLLYRMTQAWIHKAVTVSYLTRWCRELTGEPPRVRVKKVQVREGRNT